MKKSFVTLLSILLVVFTLFSCNEKADDMPQNNDDNINDWPIWLPDETSENAGCVERYSFRSLEEFKFFCATGSRNSKFYRSQNKIPPFNMLKGFFVDITQLFPELDKNSITIDDIEIVHSGEYTYACETKHGTPFLITIEYNKDSANISVDKVVEYFKTSRYDNVINADYYDPTSKLPENKGSSVYIYKLNDCIINYNVMHPYSGSEDEVTGVIIYSGDYRIVIGKAYSDNDAFFTDEVLEPITCLFSYGDDRAEALNKIAAFTESKGTIVVEDSQYLPY